MKVKVPVRVVIESLEKRLEDNKAVSERNEKAQKEFSRALQDWAKDLTKLGLTPDRASISSWRNEIEITFTMPANVSVPPKPDWDRERELHSSDVEEIQNAVRILKLTEDEYVSASTMKQIGRYL